MQYVTSKFFLKGQVNFVWKCGIFYEEFETFVFICYNNLLVCYYFIILPLPLILNVFIYLYLTNFYKCSESVLQNTYSRNIIIPITVVICSTK